MSDIKVGDRVRPMSTSLNLPSSVQGTIIETCGKLCLIDFGPEGIYGNFLADWEVVDEENMVMTAKRWLPGDPQPVPDAGGSAARNIAAKAVCDFIDADPRRFTAWCTPEMLVSAAFEALTEAGYALVKLPKPDINGDFGSVRLSTWSDGTDINVATRWYPPDVARVLAAKMLAAANLADKIDGKP